MGKALYRKYRPRSLGEVVGQEHITETLQRALKAGRISHAYLFTGPHGTGKTSVARILAHDINKLPYSDATHFDIIEIDAASNRRIDDIRDLRDKVHIAPASASFKVYIIDEVHMLTGESFNALLKTLEEPPAHAVFILATTESHKLPATIISRTQRFAFRPVAKERVATHLKQLATQEEIAIHDDALALIADYGEGSFRDSISLLDQLAHVSSGEISAQDVAQTLGLAPQATVQALTTAILAGDHTAIAKHLSDLEAGGASIGTLVNQLCQALAVHATSLPALYRLIDTILEAPRAYNPSLKLLSSIMTFIGTLPAVEPGGIKTAMQKPKPQKPASPPKTKQEAPKAEPKTKATSQTAATTTPLATLEPAQWFTVLEVTRQANPPLFAVLKQAQPLVDDGGQLVLKFKYPLHSKKVDDTKAKAQLASILQQTLGVSPVIITQVDKLATPLSKAAADPHTAEVAAIMGGGEIIEGATL